MASNDLEGLGGDGLFSDDLFFRGGSRHSLLDELRGVDLSSLGAKRVVVVGLGGLGSVVADLLVRAGVGELVLVDQDIVTGSNLQRQVLYSADDLGSSKVLAARDRLLRINPGVKIVVHDLLLDSGNLGGLLGGADLVMVCTDDFGSKLLVNDYVVGNGLRAVFGNVAGVVGSVVSFVGAGRGGCFRCLFGGKQSVGDNASIGVFSPAVVVVGSLMVAEGFRILLGLLSDNRFLSLDLWDYHLSVSGLVKNKDCSCNGS